MIDSFKILAVNDDPDQLDLLETIMRQAGYRVLTADNGKRAFEKAQVEPPDLIVSDVMMPETDGIELCRLIRADSRLKLIPILLVSGIRKDTASIVEAIENGADDYMQIPYEPVHLVAKATRLIERKRLGEAALLESENRFRSLIENSTDIISVLAPDGMILYESPSLEAVLGYQPEDLVGKNAFELIHPEDLPQVLEYFNQAVVKTQPVQPIQYRYRHLDQSWRILESVGKHFKDPLQGKVAIINSRDITRQQEALAALRDSEERFKEQYKGIPIPTYTWKKSGDDFILVDYNLASENITGGKIKDFLGITASRMYPDLPVLIEDFNRCFNERTTVRRQLEYRFRTTGEDKFLDVTFVFIAPDIVMVHSSDVTEQHAAENSLRQSEERFRLVSLATEDALWDWDIVSDSLWLSDAFYKLLGYQPGEGGSRIRLWQEVIHPDDQKRVLRHFQKTVKGGGNFWTDEYRMRTADGSYAYIFDRGYIVQNEQGETVRMIGAAINFTERKNAERALAEANERAIREYDRLLRHLTRLAQTAGTARDLTTIFRAILGFTQATVPCTGFFISLYDQEKQVRIPAYAWDDAGKEFDVSDLPPMEMSGSPHSQAVLTGEVILENDFQKAIAGQPVFNISEDKDPNLPQSSLVTPMAFMGRIVGAIEVQSGEPGAYTDEHATSMQMAANLAANAIENVRLLEQERDRAEQLRQAQKLESVGRLAGGIAHDFNNMLTAINGYSDLTLRRLNADDPLRRNIEEIKKAGERSAALTHQLLAFSRKQVLKPKVLDINEVIIDTSKLLQRLIGEDVQLSIVTHPGVGRVEVDPGQLTQVIMNLAVNARDAMPSGGNLTIETSNVLLDKEYSALHYPIKPGSYVMLAVSDNGTGIEEKAREHIFEPFYTTKEVGKGTGLGLATVYGIVKQSNGYIWVYSEVGKGTSFKIYFPRVAEETLTEEVREQNEYIPGGTETILLVEDEDAVRNLARQILESCGYHIIEARNGAEALDVCRNSQEQIDLLITDVVMPKMGGRELAEKLGDINPQIRQLFMSGYTDDAIIRQNLIDEDMNYIQKPFTFETLAQKVRQALNAKN